MAQESTRLGFLSSILACATRDFFGILRDASKAHRALSALSYSKRIIYIVVTKTTKRLAFMSNWKETTAI